MRLTAPDNGQCPECGTMEIPERNVPSGKDPIYQDRKKYYLQICRHCRAVYAIEAVGS